MPRALWKGPFISNDLIRKLDYSNKILRTRNRSTVIIPSFLGKIIEVYNGKTYFPVLITEDKLGYKLGSFIFTRNYKKFTKVERKLKK
uniref:Ribosomal protein S19 n=1 Tax=Apicomplexa sp. corallicolid ex Leiopathes glaberrima TaxID=2720216 RepID=A0A6M3RFJ8_9APIC|nr:ribosomal protein S19 [Apicomplexa sp. corallicolid ex Leiopathes glaberrima]